MKITPSFIPVKPQTEIERFETLKLWLSEYEADQRRALVALDQPALTVDERKELISGIEAIERVISQIKANML